MPRKAPTRFAVQLLLLAVGAFAVYRIWMYQPPAPVMIGDGDADDLPPPVVDVQLTQIATQTLHTYGEFFGVVEPAPALDGKPAASARVSPPMNAVVLEVYCSENQQVTKGQPLFKMAGDKNDSLNTPIVAPLDGTIVNLTIHPGERYGPAGGGVVEIVDLSRLVIALSIPQDQLQSIAPGQPAEIEPMRNSGATWDRVAGAPPGDASVAPTNGDALPTTAPAASVKTQVVSIDRRIDPATGMGSCDVAIPAGDSGPSLLPGQTARVRLVLKTFTDALTVPTVSIVSAVDGHPAINLVREDLRWSSQIPVTVLAIDGDRAAIAANDLHPNDPVVSVGAYGLPTRARIHVVGG